MNMGYPLICFDLGAPAERVLKYEHGWVISDHNTSGLLAGIINCSKHYGFTLNPFTKKTTFLHRLRLKLLTTNEEQIS